MKTYFELYVKKIFRVNHAQLSLSNGVYSGIHWVTSDEKCHLTLLGKMSFRVLIH